MPTGVVDGVGVFASLPAHWQDFCRRNRLRFARQWDAPTWRDGSPVHDRTELDAVLDRIDGVDHEFLPDDSLYIGIVTPLVVRTADGRESFSNTLLQAVTDPEFYGMSLADGTAVPGELLALAEAAALAGERPVGWASGDVAVIDNYRMMHRRGPYRQVNRDLRARHCEDLYGTPLPPSASDLERWTKSLIQGDVDLPARVGAPA